VADVGNLADLKDGIGVLAGFGVELPGLVFGKLGPDPPVEGRAWVVRVISILSGVGAALFWWYGRTQFDTARLLQITLVITGCCGAALCVYFTAYTTLSLRCPNDDTLYLAGLRLKANARRVLAGERGLQPPYGPLPATPASIGDYFCNGGKRGDLLWQGWSRTASGLLLCFLYASLLGSGALCLTAATMVLLRPPLTVETSGGTTQLEMPADVLFAFDKAELGPDAAPVLQRAASILQARKVVAATIAGHSDGLGDASYNKKPSERRAASIYQWLVKRDGLNDVRFTVLGFGATQPRAPNVKADGTDDPEGRAKNRRVEIRFKAND
jgi:outer membrane protein OmpA-like peptidoglycan-associated protein